MEAVCSEPLSAADFPDKQGIYRESPRFWAPLQALAAQEMKSFQCVAAGSMLRRTGNLFWGNREILPLEKPRVLASDWKLLALAGIGPAFADMIGS